MGIDVTTIRTDNYGNVLGWCDDELGQCFAAKPKAQAKPEPMSSVQYSAVAELHTAMGSVVYVEVKPSNLARFWNWLTGTSQGAKDCPSREGSKVIDHLRDGSVMNPPDAAGNPDAVPHPTDDGGQPYLGDDIIDTLDATGTALIQGGKIFAVRSGRLIGSGLQNVNLEVHVMTNPESIWIDWNANNTEDASDVYMPCEDGLFAMNTLDATEYEWRMGCPTVEYDKLWACPEDEGNRLALNLAYYYMICYNQNEPVKFKEYRYFTPEQMLDPEFDPANEQRIGTACNSTLGFGPVVLTVPSECNETGEADIEIGYQPFINARNAVDGYSYFTRVRIILTLAPNQ